MSRHPALARSVAVVALTAALAGAAAAQQHALPRGVEPATHAAIQRGIEWLTRSQAADGGWREVGPSASHPTAMTGLAGMALLASGSTPTRGRHWRVVRESVEFLLRHADAGTGLVAVRGEDTSLMHGHGFATLYLASVFGMEEDGRTQQRLKNALDRAVGLIAAAQSAAGGWYYTPEANTDEGSVTVTQIQALRACRMAGIVTDKRTVDRAVDYVRRSQNADGGIRYRLGNPGPGMPAITAAGIAVLYHAGVYDDEAFVAKAHDFCRRRLHIGRDATGHEYYAWLYWSQALWHRGGEPWDEHYARLSAWLREHQHADGSWDGDQVGRVYGTSVALSILKLPWALIPIHQR
jgi:hypothetical protein